MSDAVATRMVSQVVPAALEGERVDRVVSMILGLPRREVSDLVSAGRVRLDGSAVASRSRRVTEGEQLDVMVSAPTDPAGLEPEPEVAFAVVHADDEIIVIDKPAGLVVHPGAGHRTGTLVHGLLARYPEVAGVGQAGRPGIVHRLDVGTSGLLVVARTPAAYEHLVDQLARRSVERRYLVLVWGRFDVPEGEIDAPVGRSPSRPTAMAVTSAGRSARTRYRVISHHRDPGDVALIECQLATGRTHQIRVHLSAIGHPVVGDHRYGGAHRPLALNRPFLHAHSLAFDHPRSRERVRFTSVLPSELEAVRALLG